VTQRRRVMHTAAGTRDAAFGAIEWSLLSAIALMWGSSFVLIAVGLESLSPPVITLGRLLLGAAAIALVPRARLPVERGDMVPIALLGITWMAVPFTLFPLAQQWVDSSIAGLINGSTPLFAGVFAAALLARRPALPQVAGLTLGFAGVVVITVQSIEGGDQSALGLAMLVLAAACYGFSLNISVPLVQRYGSLRVLLRAQLVAIVTVTPFGLWGLGSSSFSWDALGAVAFLGVLSTGLAMVLMTELAKRAGATRASVTIYVVPFVAVALGATLRSERITVMSLVGGLLIVAGAWSSSRRERPTSVGPPHSPSAAAADDEAISAPAAPPAP
jgi:drug/metabolite transporter (DMT)-like permease